MSESKDRLIKGLALHESIRVTLIHNTMTVNEAINRHDLWPTATSVLGKTLTMGQIMGSMLKGEEALTIKLNGNGPLGNIIVDANAKGMVRGYVDHPHVSFVGAKGINDAMGIGTDGFLDVIKDLKMKDLFTSSIAITGDIASDFTVYFLESEQTHTAILLGILVGVDNRCIVSGGLLLQLLPNATLETIDFIEARLHTIKNVSELLLQNSLSDLFSILFDNDWKIVEEREVSFFCGCSKEQFARSLITLGQDELTKIKDEDHKIETVCHYCNSHYHFDEKEIEQLIREINHD